MALPEMNYFKAGGAFVFGNLYFMMLFWERL